jgi:hypothetical protein
MISAGCEYVGKAHVNYRAEVKNVMLASICLCVIQVFSPLFCRHLSFLCHRSKDLWGYQVDAIKAIFNVLTSSKCTSKDDSIERGKNVAKIS